MLRALTIVAVVLTAVGCGDDGSASTTAADPMVERCSNFLVLAVEGFDTTGIDSSDGLDDDERSLGTARLEEVAAANPILVGEDGPCADVLADLSDERAERLTARLDPEVVALLRETDILPFKPG
jgi:hypothetical protein